MDARSSPRGSATPDVAASVTSENIERLWPQVRAVARSMLKAHGVRVADDDLRSAYNLAWHALNTRLLAGETIETLPAFLAKVTYWRTLSDVRSQHRDRVELVDSTEPNNALERHAATVEDAAERVDNLAALRAMAEALADRVLFASERERQLATLIVVHEYTRREAAARLGLSPQRVEKLMDGGPDEPGLARKLAALKQLIRQGRWCESRRSLMVAYAENLHVPGSPRYEAAREHLKHCASCRAMLRAREVAALLLPPLPLEVVAGDDSHRAALLEAFTHSAAARSAGREATQRVADAAAAHGASASDVVTAATTSGGVGAGATAAASALLGGGAIKVVATCVAVGAICGGAYVALKDDHPARAGRASRAAPPAASAALPQRVIAARSGATAQGAAPAPSRQVAANTPTRTRARRRQATTATHRTKTQRKAPTSAGASPFSFEAAAPSASSASAPTSTRSSPPRSSSAGAEFSFEGG